MQSVYQISEMIQNVDTNANGPIDFNEFIAMMVTRGPNNEDDVAHAFKVFDNHIKLNKATQF